MRFGPGAWIQRTARATQHKLTYGLRRCPIRAAFQTKLPTGVFLHLSTRDGIKSYKYVLVQMNSTMTMRRDSKLKSAVCHGAACVSSVKIRLRRPGGGHTILLAATEDNLHNISGSVEWAWLIMGTRC